MCGFLAHMNTSHTRSAVRIALALAYGLYVVPTGRADDRSNQTGPAEIARAEIANPAGARPARYRQPVALELVLAVDTSVSVSTGEFALQMLGLANAFRDPSVLAAIRGAGENGIAVVLMQWGVGLQQRIAVNWTHVRDAASAERFAHAIETSPRHFVGNGTAISRALKMAFTLFEENGFRGTRRVIDVSGDGRNNSGSQPGAMRDLIVAQGVVINGLAILDGDRALGRYFRSNVTGGQGSFVMTANTFADYAAAIRRKLLREISLPVAMAP